MSKKQDKILRELKKVYGEMMQDHMFCRECGSNRVTPAHLVPRSYSRSLITVKDNIKWLCVGCHRAWDFGTVEEKKAMKCYNYFMEEIRKLDESYYKLLKFKHET